MSDRDREWPLLQAMWDVDTVEIPRPRWYDATGELHGDQDDRHGPRRGHAAAARRSAPDADLAAARTIFLDVAAALLRTPLDGAARRASSARRTGTATSTAPSTSTSDAEARAGRQQPDHPLRVGVAAGQQAAAGAARPRPRRLPAGQHPRRRRAPAGRHRLGVHPHRRPPRGHRLLQREPAARTASTPPTPRRSSPSTASCTGFTEEQVNPRGDGVLLHPRHGRAVRADDAGRRRPVRGQPKGIMAPFLINSLCYFHEKYLEICTR